MRPTVSPTGVEREPQGHARRRRLLHGRRRVAQRPRRLPLTFDVVPENGDTWQLDLSHLLRGAHTLIDEKVLLEDAGGETRFQSDVNGRVRVGGGAWQNFNVTRQRPVGGARPLRRRGHDQPGVHRLERHWSLTGHDGADHHRRVRLRPVREVELERLLPGRRRRRGRPSASAPTTPSPTASPPVAIPGLGNRNLLDDGHKASVVLTATPGG